MTSVRRTPSSDQLPASACVMAVAHTRLRDMQLQTSLVGDTSSSAHEQANPMPFVQSNLFIPISLGNHYYSTKILRQVMTEFISKSSVSVIFLCDRLRFLSYCMRGDKDVKSINSRIQIQINQMNRTLTNLGIDCYPNAFVANWSFLEEDQRYDGLLASLQDFVQADPEVRQCLNDHAVYLIHRFYGLESSDLVDSIELQRQYILEETALSLFMTEIRGYNVEVYRRGMGFVDYLYSQRPAALKLLTGAATLKRKFVSIEHWLGCRTNGRDAPGDNTWGQRGNRG
jgi:tRNA-dependent cyclodipeptide synthase